MLKIKKQQVNYVAVYPWMLGLGIQLDIYELYVFAYIYNLNTFYNKYLLFDDVSDNEDEIPMATCKYLKMPIDWYIDAVRGLEEKGLITATYEDGRTYYSVREDLL